MEIFDLPQKDQMHKDEIEILQKKKQEFKFIGKLRRRPGLTLFSFNRKTMEIKVAPMKQTKDVDFKTRKATIPAQVFIERDCIYRWALNKKSLIKRLKKQGIIKE